ncbi:uncharacterized protein LOC110413825 [Herrania umbratica]|uniref:Uncharacterized protein LOC110413825 n=1 Tax=Herrania umbratica TaxID=108875 RepID=A0A6J1A1H4_9ROSI|nr:uncharacterized protein LOC110413825 [Herrania umbratica]
MELLQDYDASWSSSTNWSIAGGSLPSSVTFESSFSPITDSDEHEHDIHDPSAVGSTPKSPLILCPTSPDSTTPCEITIAFAQKHEVRQVYVRSTARVYEIYNAPKHQGSNEYLFTVRCGIASRDEEVLHAANPDEAALAHLKEANKESDEKRLKNDSSSNSNEDDWVEVKAPDTPVLDSGSSVPSNFSVSSQDLYEATAEINDTNPCMSITLRLLSLQNKGCVCVDELYVFGDPVESDDSENEVGQMGNAAGSSLMAMLAPTLLQLSKTAGLRHIQNEDSFGTKENEKTQENGPKTIEPLNCANKIPQEGRPSLANQQESIASTIELNRHEIPPQLKDREAKGDLSCGHIEKFLEHLVSRVSRVEDFLSKFEENMLKPISSIDSRLQRVEQQLEELTKKPKNSELPSCTRYSAPEFSCHDSDNYTPYNIGNESSCEDLCESREKDFSSSLRCDEIIYSVNATQSFPSLVVTAPEFSNADDEEDDHASKIDSPKDKPKQTMSIDDALASALASFLSSTSIEPQKYTQALAVKAPDFSNEEDGSIDKKVSRKSHFGVTSESCSLDTSDGMDSMIASVSSNCPLERIVEVTCSLNDHDSEQTTKEVVEDCEGQVACHGTVDCIVTSAKHDLHQIAGDVGNGEVSSGTNKTLVLDEADILNQFLENHVDDGSGADEEGVPGSTEIKAEVTKQGLHEEFLQNVLELSYSSSVVDFESPILDVKFTSQDNSNDKSPLEALLFDTSDMPFTDNGASCSKKSDDGSQAGEVFNLISVGDGEPACPATDGHFSVDLDGDGLSSLPLNLEVKYLEDYHACSNQELPIPSLI